MLRSVTLKFKYLSIYVKLKRKPHKEIKGKYINSLIKMAKSKKYLSLSCIGHDTFACLFFWLPYTSSITALEPSFCSPTKPKEYK